MHGSSTVWVARCLLIILCLGILITWAGTEANSQMPLTRDDPLSSLISATLHNDLRAAQLAMERGARPDTRVLVLASSAGRVEIVRMLLQNGANPDDAARLAQEGGMVWGDTLWKYAANPDSTDVRLIPGAPLLAACDGGHIEVVKLLVDKGANLNAKDQNGQTPLMKTAASGQLDIVKILVERGADLTLTDERGDTALSMASKGLRSKVVDLLKARGARE
jgi:ankyrin repeat protein